ncbi:hypothetical protein [Rhodobacter calidifons]|uniref:Dynamin family protein n=1 Tax=Rhodobacter calidifons TaxID=2715277 RepID=A0ABX0G4X7_9RHOB|nr:hypothetical protein [Rhodobacter calidifons]NHB75914.1 hypothetical protein [Rhodobacter calidifons]
MANADEELTVAQRLGRALDRGLLPAGGPAEAAERLLERLERPARLALLGLPGSGKSSILNLLVGANVVPETLRLPTIIVQHGTTARMICTLTDGSTKIVPGSDLADVLPLAPALVTLEMDLPALKVISLLEVSAGPMEAEQKRAASWAAKRADIVIWCTTSYLPKEQAVWESLPDSVKDNSFMFLTKVDLLGSRQSAAAMHDRVELRAGEEFRQILSVSAKEARAAVPPGGPVNRELFRDSGAAAVIAAIKTRVQSGRRADMDMAELLLARHVEAGELVARRFAEPAGAAAEKGPWVPPPEPAGPAENSEDAAIVDRVRAAAEVSRQGPEAAPPDAAEAEADASAPEVAGVPEPEPEAVAESELEPEPGPEAALVPAPVEWRPEVDPVPDPAAPRKRFADRIKRVATEGDLAPAAKVPLRSTWKSKAELEAPAAPAPEPAAQLQHPARRPRPSAAVEAEETQRSRQPTGTGAPAAPEVEAPAAPAGDLAAGPDRPMAPRAIAERPEADPDKVAAKGGAADRLRAFGAARRTDGLVRGAPLPDLSSLRARPEEMAEAPEPDPDDSEAEATATEQVGDEDQDAASAVRLSLGAFDAENAAPTRPGRPDLTPGPRREPMSDTPLARPRLFGREARPQPAEPPAPPREAVPPPRMAPVTRLPAAARARPAEPVPEPAAPQTADAALLSPRAIMMRDRPAETAQPARRRERPRIAARAVPASAAPAAPAPEIAVDAGLAEQAIAVISSRAAALEREIDPEAKVPVDLILEHARETGEQVMTLVSQGKTEAMRRINGDLGEVLDLIMLMQLEKGHAPADDALTLLLQLRRELETLRAV